MTSENSNPELRAELEELRTRLAEAEETLRAIRSGEVDALVVAGNQGEQVHLLGAGDYIYRQFIEAVSEGTATLSAIGDILSCNDALAKTMRRPLDQVLGTVMKDHLLPDDLEIFSAVLAQAGQGSSRRKVRLKTSEGSLVPMYLSATLLRSAGMEPVYCLVYTDLEEVISAEETLRESEEQFRATFEQAAVGIAHATLDGRWLRINQKLADIVGYTTEELLAKSFSEISHPDDLEADLAHLRQMLAGEIAAFSMEKRYFRKDMSIVWVNLTVSLARKPSGEPNYFIAVIEDISARKQADQQIKIQLEELQRWQDVMLGREDRVQEIKREVNELCRRLGETVRYPSQAAGPAESKTVEPES